MSCNICDYVNVIRFTHPLMHIEYILAESFLLRDCKEHQDCAPVWYLIQLKSAVIQSHSHVTKCPQSVPAFHQDPGIWVKKGRLQDDIRCTLVARKELQINLIGSFPGTSICHLVL